MNAVNGLFDVYGTAYMEYLSWSSPLYRSSDMHLLTYGFVIITILFLLFIIFSFSTFLFKLETILFYISIPASSPSPPTDPLSHPLSAPQGG